MTAAASDARRPRVICHMIASVDGRILTDGWPLSEEGWRQYELVHEGYAPDAWLCGRVTMEEHFAQGLRSDAEIAREHHGAPREDFRAPGGHESFAFAVDAGGRLAWETNDIDGDHVVTILSERVSTSTWRSCASAACRTSWPGRATWTCRSRWRRSGTATACAR